MLAESLLSDTVPSEIALRPEISTAVESYVAYLTSECLGVVDNAFVSTYTALPAVSQSPLLHVAETNPGPVEIFRQVRYLSCPCPS